MPATRKVDQEELLATLEAQTTDEYGGATAEELEAHLPWARKTIAQHLQALESQGRVVIEWRFDTPRLRRGFKVADSERREVPA
ncbi:hypothetical protein ACLI4U_19190 (plasmid) [Natrialbaceae archaeon A-CW2]